MEFPLTELKKKTTAVVKRIEGGMIMQRRINSMGVIPGKKINIISSQLFGGPIVVDVEGFRVAIGRGMADRVIVEAEG